MRHDSSETRNRILQAALTLFEKKGYDGTSIDDLIAAAGVSKGAVYHHFNSKEDLLFLLHDQFIAYVLKAARRIYRQEGTPDETLRALILDLCRSIGLFRSHVTVFFQEKRFFTEAKFSTVRSKQLEYVSILKNTLQKGMDAGLFRPDIPPGVLTFAILGMCNWTYQWLHPDGPLTFGQVGEMFAGFIVDGLRTGRSQSHSSSRSIPH